MNYNLLKKLANQIKEKVITTKTVSVSDQLHLAQAFIELTEKLEQIVIKNEGLQKTIVGLMDELEDKEKSSTVDLKFICKGSTLKH